MLACARCGRDDKKLFLPQRAQRWAQRSLCEYGSFASVAEAYRRIGARIARRPGFDLGGRRSTHPSQKTREGGHPRRFRFPPFEKHEGWGTQR